MTLFRYDDYGRRVPVRNSPHWSLWALVLAAVLVATGAAGDWWQAVKVLAGLGGLLVLACWLAGFFEERER